MKTNIIYNKSCISMPEVDDNSIDCIITSPPYWALRDYGTEANQIWGGNPECEHQWGIAPIAGRNKPLKDDDPKFAKGMSNPRGNSQFCLLCGAWHGQLGLEPTLKMYLDHLLLITAECKRVLKPTGVMWWDHGDCYGGKCMMMQNYRLILRLIDEQGWILRNTVIWNKPNGMPSSVKDRLSNKYEPVFMLVKSKERSCDIKEFIEPPILKNWQGWLAAIIDGEGTIGIRRSRRQNNHDVFGPYIVVNNSCKDILNKCLEITRLGVVRKTTMGTNFPMYKWEVSHQKAISVIGDIYPYLIEKKEQAKVLIALQKTNIYRGNNEGENRGPRPISEKEYQNKIGLWILIKQLNQKEIRDSGLPEPNLNRNSGCEKYWFDLDAIREKHKLESNSARPRMGQGNQTIYNQKRKGIQVPGQSSQGIHRKRHSGYYGADGECLVNPSGKNPGDTWTIPTVPYPSAHFATFPPKLIIKPILSSCPEWICRKCGEARVRITKRESGFNKQGNCLMCGTSRSKHHQSQKSGLRFSGSFESDGTIPCGYNQTIGWTDCGCNAGWRAGIILDPFAGSGTTLAMAHRYHRRYIGYEVNQKYLKFIYKRIAKEDTLFNTDEISQIGNPHQ